MLLIASKRGSRTSLTLWMAPAMLGAATLTYAQAPADTLYHFPPSYRGASGLVQGTDGNLYGTRTTAGRTSGAWSTR